MPRKILFLSLIAIVAAMWLFVVAKDYYNEKQLNACITNILLADGFNNIEVSTIGRGKKPVLQGHINPRQKEKLFFELYQHCKIDEIQDFLTITAPIKAIYSTINFQIDNINNVVNISGIANNQKAIDNVLSSFNTAIENNMSISETPWTLIPDITINKQANDADFSIAITLLFSAIDTIKLTDISIKNKQLTLRGLVRDKLRKEQTLDKIQQLFSDEYTIVDELEIVLKHKLSLPGFQIENFPPPIVENPIHQN